MILHPAAPAGTDQTVLLAAIADGEVHTDASDTMWWGDRPLTLPEVLWLMDDNDYVYAFTGKRVRLTKIGRAVLDEMWARL